MPYRYEVVKIRDQQQEIVTDTYFKRTCVFCNADKTDNREHTDHVLTVPK